MRIRKTLETKSRLDSELIWLAEASGIGKGRSLIAREIMRETKKGRGLKFGKKVVMMRGLRRVKCAFFGSKMGNNMTKGRPRHSSEFSLSVFNQNLTYRLRTFSSPPRPHPCVLDATKDFFYPFFTFSFRSAYPISHQSS